MTSGTGNRLFPARRLDDGFTLIEIMVVVAIIVTLFGLVAAGVATVRGRASQKATEAMMQRLLSYLEDYREKTGRYPADGLDSEVKNDEGERIEGSACLYYFLAVRPTAVRELRAGKEFRSEEPPIAKFVGRELSEEEPDRPGVREIIDGWGNPFHYDNTENDIFQPQRGEVHVPPAPDNEHTVDPRSGDYEVGPKNAVPEPGIQGSGYDLWSHGEQEADQKELKSFPIASWNLGT